MAIEKKIRELQEREASNDGLSDSNQAFLSFLQEWKKYAGTDPIIVIQPRGALTKRGVKIPAKVIQVTDQTAADLFAFARQRGQLVRIATKAEVEAYYKHRKAQQEAARGRAVAERTALARNQIASLLQVDGVPFIEPAPQVETPGSLTTDFMDEDEAEALVPENVGDVTEESAGASLGDLVTNQKVLGQLREGGISSIEQLASASPEDLVALGIGPRVSAGLIANASAALAPSEGDAAA